MTYNWPLVDICLFCMFGQQKTGSEGTSFLGEHNFYRVLCSLALQPWASYLTSLSFFSSKTARKVVNNSTITQGYCKEETR